MSPSQGHDIGQKSTVTTNRLLKFYFSRDLDGLGELVSGLRCHGSG